MNLQENYGEVFCQEMSEEMYRLELVSKTYDFISQQQIKSLHLPQGARCLDIGSGSGTMAEWLVQQPETQEGEVVALDRYINLLKERLQPKPNLRIVQHDLTEEGNPVGTFDFINVRFVLMHIRERAELLEKIASWVKPGGWLLVTDIIDLGTEHAADPLYRKTMSTMWEVLINFIGTDKNWSASLPSRFETLGFENVKNEVYLPPIGKGAPMSDFWYLTWKEIHEQMIDLGKLDPDELTQAENNLRYGNVTALSPGMFACMGRKK